MNTRQVIVAGVVCLVLMGAAFWYVTDSQQLMATAPAAAPAGNPAAAATQVQPGGTATPSAPWASASASPANVASEAMVARERQARELDAMQADIAKSMRDGKQPDPRKIDAALAKVEEASGQTVVGGVDIEAVRSNVAIAQKMQVLAAELDAESKKEKLDNDRLRALIVQVQQLQSQLRVDVSATAAPSKAAATPR